MNNGRQFSMDYGPVLPGQPEFWRDETTYRMSVGFYLVLAGLAAGMIVDKGCPLVVDFKAQTATPVKNVRINAAVASGVSIQIAKGSLIKVGDFVSNGTATVEVKAVDKSNAAYDTITSTELLCCSEIIQLQSSSFKTPLNTLSFTTH